MRKFVWFILIAATLAELTASARIKIDPASLGRQERRLEDSGRHYNVGYVEYKSDVVDEKRLFRHSNDSEEEIDEYVVIESDVKSNVAADDVDDDRRYEEVDDHYDADDDEDEDDDRIVSNSVPHRGLVPQLWSNYSGPDLPPPESVSCNDARLQCAYRAGCGLALQNYVLGCSDLVKGTGKTCNTHCRHSLIALMSTPEGQRLMKCNCSGDDSCERTKTSIEPCQKEVTYATQPDTVVSCSAAQWICAADPLCSTALDYYNRFCGAMFAGKRCTKRCLNSINILRRQSSASKLETCYCDGTEKDFDCPAVKRNMDRLCFGPPEDDSDLENEIETDGNRKHSVKSFAASLKEKFKKFLLLLSVMVTLLAAFVGGSVHALFQGADSDSS